MSDRIVTRLSLSDLQHGGSLVVLHVHTRLAEPDQHPSVDNDELVHEFFLNPLQMRDNLRAIAEEVDRAVYRHRARHRGKQASFES